MSLMDKLYATFGYNTLYMLILLALIGVMILGVVVQAVLRSNFKKYSGVRSMQGRPACDVVREILYSNGCGNVNVVQISGSLTDNYNPRTNTVSLSESVYGSSSIAALAVATHELGHVMQHQEGYVPIKIRNLILPFANIGSMFAPYIVLVGLLMAHFQLAIIGIWLYVAVLAFQLVTLPVEFNASARAIRMLADGGYIQNSEKHGAKKVLSMAAMTYVVATLATLISLLRLLLIVSGGTRRRD